MPTLTITVVMETDDELDDSMGLLESQVAQALGWIGDVQTVDIGVDEDQEDQEASLDEQLTSMMESDEDIEWE